MTSPKRRLKEQNQLICDSDQGGGKKSENVADIIYGSPLAYPDHARGHTSVWTKDQICPKIGLSPSGHDASGIEGGQEVRVGWA